MYNTAQQIHHFLGMAVSDSSGLGPRLNPTSRKSGPGRVHKSGHKSKKKSLTAGKTH